ncbi:MAG: signal peptidase I [Pseudomonadales bacterium]|jgi:signal peptidase I|tara:strand:- start:3928 stop:4659 length:732 start_codon:yes stop_codon:yes gene_type:complete
MDLNFELILTIIFLLAGAFWLLNKFVIKQEEGLIEFTGSLAPVLGLVLVLRSFMIEPFQIPSQSMVPTLKVGDFILVSKWTYGIRLPVLRTKIIDVGSPERGDVMVFFPPHEERYFIKRVVGLPGDKIHVLNGVVFINGDKMEQTPSAEEPNSPRSVVMTEKLGGVEHMMQKRTSPTRLSQNFSAVVPEGHYFMMGDNRDNSSDSRVWGPVPEDRIVGKAFARWMFWDKFLSLPSFDRAGKIQ